MRYAEWIYNWPRINTKYAGSDGRLLAGKDGQLVLWTFPEASVVPEHQHGPLVGIVVAGEIDITIGGVRRLCRPGDMFSVEDQEPHSATIAADSLLVEIYQENDRYRAEDPA